MPSGSAAHELTPLFFPRSVAHVGASSRNTPGRFNFTRFLMDRGYLLRQVRRNHEDSDRYRRIMIQKFTEKGIPWIDGSFPSVAQVFSRLAGYHDFRKRGRSGEGNAGNRFVIRR